MTRTVYPIRNTAGELIAEHVRVDLPTGKRMYWQVPGCDPHDGLMGLSTSDLPLYGSEILPGLTVGETVIVTEGERAADALAQAGVAALATVTGASSTPGEDALSPLLPFDVVLWPDHDEPGEQHMSRVAARLLRLGGRARRLEWGRQKGDDAADFLDEGTLGHLGLLIRAAVPLTVEALGERYGAPLRVVRPSYDHREDDDRIEAARSHLVEVVEARLGPPRKRAGRSLLWCCPFHAERTPSFKVDLREPFFRCFGCGARGDVFAFLERMEGACFRDALSSLAPARALGGIPRLGA